MKIRKKLEELGSPNSWMDGYELEYIRCSIDDAILRHPDWLLRFDVDYDYDDTLVLSIIGERDETPEERNTRVIEQKVDEDNTRATELALLARLKAKYE
jgi:hypothetical protein